ncbi:MAG: hypothetical protein L0027_12880 [Candidatus Rokubacteria bacterium]|nr:hypothetical protein [Candidatus Rokubacteria bacterium]
MTRSPNFGVFLFLTKGRSVEQECVRLVESFHQAAGLKIEGRPVDPTVIQGWANAMAANGCAVCRRLVDLASVHCFYVQPYHAEEWGGIAGRARVLMAGICGTCLERDQTELVELIEFHYRWVVDLVGAGYTFVPDLRPGSIVGYVPVKLSEDGYAVLPGQ